jgi:hypothetical protein
MGSHQVPNVFPKGVSNSTLLKPHMFFAQSPFLLFGGPKGGGTPFFHRNLLFLGASTVLFFWGWDNQIDSLQKTKKKEKKSDL